jgi:type IV fimbrial biogenesis protein FimT
MKDNTGFTLMELAVAVAIFAVLSAIAIPNMIRWRNNAAFRGAVNTLAGDLAAAKQAAIRANSNVVVDFTANGYLIYIDDGNGTGDADGDNVPDGMNNGVLEGTERTLRARTIAASVTIDLGASTFAGDTTLFDSRGRCPAASTGNLVINGSGALQNTVSINRLGKISVT